jgi:hypothetical protein
MRQFQNDWSATLLPKPDKRALAAVLEGRYRALRSLDVGFNGIGAAGATALAGNATLRSLNMSFKTLAQRARSRWRATPRCALWT